MMPKWYPTEHQNRQNIIKMGPTIDHKSMGNRLCVAKALLERSGVPRARSENWSLIYFGVPWRIFGAIVGPAGSKGGPTLIIFDIKSRNIWKNKTQTSTFGAPSIFGWIFLNSCILFGSFFLCVFLLFTSLFRGLLLDDLFKLFYHFSDFLIFGRTPRTRILLQESYGFRTFTIFEKYVFSRTHFSKHIEKSLNCHILFSSNFMTFSVCILALIFLSILMEHLLPKWSQNRAFGTLGTHFWDFGRLLGIPVFW